MQVVITHIRAKREIFYVLCDQIVAAAGASQFDHHIISFIPKIRRHIYDILVGRPVTAIKCMIESINSSAEPTLIVFA